MSPNDRIAALEAECAKLRAENESLKAIVQGKAPRSAGIVPYLRDRLREHKAYIEKYGDDMPEISNWRWNAGSVSSRA